MLDVVECSLLEGIPFEAEIAATRWRPEGIKFKWMNEFGESNKPYDFIVYTPDGRELYIDAKGSTKYSGLTASLSVRDLKYDAEHHPHHLYMSGNWKLISVTEVLSSVAGDQELAWSLRTTNWMGVVFRGIHDLQELM